MNRRGYIVAEYLLVAFFFLLLMTAVFDQLVKSTAYESDKIVIDLACQKAERLFYDIVDKPPSKVGWERSWENFEGGTATMADLRKNFTHFGLSTGRRYEVDYNAWNFVLNNISSTELSNFTDNTDSYKLKYVAIGADANSIYANKKIFGSNPEAQIWLNATGLGSGSVIHNVIGIAANSSSVGALFETTIVFPNSSIIASKRVGLEGTDSVTLTNSSSGGTAKISFRLNSSDEDVIYLAYTTNGTTYATWDTDWIGGGHRFLEIDRIVRKNNLFAIQNLKFENATLKKEYSVFLGNNTLAKGEIGAPQIDESKRFCEFKRRYIMVANESIEVAQKLVTNTRIVNATRRFPVEISVLAQA